MARNRQFKAPREEFPEDEELAQGSLGRRGAAGETHTAKKGNKPNFIPEDEQDEEGDQRRAKQPAGKGAKKPQRPQDEEDEERPPPGKKPPAKKGRRPLDEDEEETPAVKPKPEDKKAVKGKQQPPEEEEAPKKPTKGGKKSTANKATTDEEPQDNEQEEKKSKKGKKKGSAAETERETPRSARPKGRFCSRRNLLAWFYLGLNLVGVGAGVVALILDWVKNSSVTISLSEVKIDVAGVTATTKLKDAYDSCTSSCSNLEYYYATSYIMFILGGLGLLCALLKAVLMALLLLLPRFSHEKLLKYSLPAAPALWVLGVAGMIVGFMKLKDDQSDLTIDIGFAIAFGNVGLLAANAALGFFAVRKLFGSLAEVEVA